MNIRGMNKAKILAALYNNSRPQGIGAISASSMDMTEEEAQKLLDDGQTYFDYLGGRVMKVDLGSDELTTFLYDRDLGQGACERVVNSINA